jgi:hypothetical protein
MAPGLVARAGRLALAAAAIPPVLVGLIIAVYGLDVPYWDQWELVPVLRAAAESRVEVAALWARHNEHRVPIPKALMLVLAAVTRWDVRGEMAASFGIALVTLALLRSTLVRTIEPLAPGAVPHLTLVASLGCFAVTGWERWLWGWNVCVHLVALSAAAAAWALARWGERGRGALVALLAAAAGALSFGSGLAVLALVPVAVWAAARGSPRQRLVRFVATGTAAGVAILVVAVGLPAPSLRAAVESPGALALYLLVYLGSVFRFLGVAGAGVAGGLGVLAFAGAAVRVWSRRPAARGAMCPWLLLGGSMVLGAGMTAVARSALFGPSQALSPRYTALAGLFWLSVAAVSVMALARPGGGPELGRAARAALLAGWLGLAALGAGASLAHARGEIRYQHARLLEASRCLRSDAAPASPCLQLVYHDPGPVIQERVAWLRRARLSLFARPSSDF